MYVFYDKEQPIASMLENMHLNESKWQSLRILELSKA